MVHTLMFVMLESDEEYLEYLMEKCLCTYSSSCMLVSVSEDHVLQE